MTLGLLSKIKPLCLISCCSLIFTANNLFALEFIIKPKHDLQHYQLSQNSPPKSSFFKVMDSISSLNLIKVKVKDDMSKAVAMASLYDYFEARYVVENIMLHTFLDPTDPKRNEQWALDMVKASEAWGFSLGSHEVVVAVIDTGIDYEHEDLKDNIWLNPHEEPNNGVDDDQNGYVDDVRGWDFRDNDNDPNDETGARNPGHGTHCAGIIGAACGNDVGVCGIIPKVSLMPIRFLGADGSGDLFASVKAIEYAVNNGAQVISASWGAKVPKSTAQPIIDAIKAADDKGVIFVAAAGNDGKSNDVSATFPANAQTPNMISVAASDRNDGKPSWSNYGRLVDIASPGAEILSTIPNNEYQNLNGTSMATPLVAGLVALMKSLDTDISGAQARSIMQSFGDKVDINTASNRRINAYEAMKALSEKKLTVVPAAATISLEGELDFSAWGGSAPYKFSSENPDVATISETGHLVAVSKGDVIIKVTDANGDEAQAVSVKVGESAPEVSECPLPDPMICLLMCVIQPKLPWCGDMPELPIPHLKSFWPSSFKHLLQDL